MGSGNSQFDKLLEGDEVERFLSSFILPDDVRADAQKKNPNVAYPKDVQDVLRDVKEIWEKKGFISPAELRNELIQKYIPNADPKLKSFIQDTELSRNARENVTGYLNKEHAYIATGLGHLHAIETGKPIAMVEVDFSNMGGTNDEFARRIAAEKGIPYDQVNRADAEAMTDRAVRLLSDAMTKALADELPKGAKIIPIRTGGDELRLMFTGVDDPAELARITNKLHAAVEIHVAGMGLQDHPHLKDPDNPVRNGFGAAVTIQDMRKIENPATLIQMLDEKIKMEKEKVGHTRLGTIDEAQERRVIERQIRDGSKKVPDGITQEAFVKAQIAEVAAKAKANSDMLHKRNPVHNPTLAGGLAGFDNYIERTTPLLGDSPIIASELPHALASADPVGAGRPEGVAPLASMDERRTAVANQHFAAEKVEMSAAERHFLGMSVQALTSVDPSAQVTMPKDIIAVTEAYTREVDEYRAKLDPNDPDVKEGLKKAGLKSVNDVSPHVMAVSYHNLAGLNNTLGHHNADLFLREFGTMIDKSFADAGFDTKGKKPFTIAHHGGGNFSVLVDPAGVDAKGKPAFMSAEKLKEVERHIAAHVEKLNAVKIDRFLEDRGVAVDADMRAELDKKGATTIATIQDPKDREHSKSKETKARVNGIHTAVSTNAVVSAETNPARGQTIIGNVRSQADANMTALRDEHILRQQPAKPADFVIASDPQSPARAPHVTDSPSHVAAVSATPIPTSRPSATPNGISASAGTMPHVDQTAPAMGRVEVVGATVLKPQTQENLRPDPKVTPTVTQVATPNTNSANAANFVQPAANEARISTSTEKPATPAHGGGGGGSVKLEGRLQSAGSGVGVGMGVYSLSNKLGADGSAAEDLRNKDTRKLAQAGIVADVGGIVADTADGLATLQKVSKGLSSASKVSRAAAPVAAVLGVASGAVDYKIAVIKGDAGKASEAIGGAAGGMVGAAAGGIVGAKAGAAAGAAIGALFGGVGAVPGAAVGAFFGGIAGAIGGAFAGGEAGKKVADATLKESFQRKFDEDRRLAAAAAAASAKPTVIAAAPASAPATVKPTAAPTASPTTTVAATSAPAKPAASADTVTASAKPPKSDTAKPASSANTADTVTASAKPPKSPAAANSAPAYESLYPTTVTASAATPAKSDAKADQGKPATASAEREHFKTAPDVGSAFGTATAKAQTQENRGPAVNEPTVVAASTNKVQQTRVI